MTFIVHSNCSLDLHHNRIDLERQQDANLDLPTIIAPDTYAGILAAPFGLATMLLRTALDLPESLLAEDQRISTIFLSAAAMPTVF